MVHELKGLFFKNVELPLIVAGIKKAERVRKVLDALMKVGLESKIKNLASDLSGGEKQRVAIARAIVNNPKFIIADEPCGNLDTKNSKNILEILSSINNEGKTVVMVTHNHEHVKIAKRSIHLVDGKIIDT